MEQDLEEQKAKVEIWKYLFGFADIALVNCAIELGIPDIIASHGEPMTLSQLSSAIGTGCNTPVLYRVLRFLVQRRVLGKSLDDDGGAARFSLTPISRLMMKHGEKGMATFFKYMNHPAILGSWHGISSVVRGGELPPFLAANGQDFWEYAAQHPEFSELFNQAMGSDAQCVLPVVEGCMEVFHGLGMVVDVGGGIGTTMSALVKLCPWIKGINFDLPHVVAGAPAREGLEHVGGDMFVKIPKADAIFLKSILHDWGDKECIELLGNCREAIPKEGGKVIIVDVVIDEDEQHDLKDVKFAFDMAMLALANNGQERTEAEWKNLLNKAGFRGYTITPIRAVQSVIVAYP